MTIAQNSEVTFNCSSEDDIPNPDCPGCLPFVSSDVNQDAIDQCASSEGDGVITVAGDYDFDAVYVEAICENYYGAFVFGLNCNSYRAGGPADAPLYYTTVPSLFVPASGSALLNSSCPIRISRFLQFDFHASFFGDAVDYEAISPATFQTDVVLDWDTTGAHGERPPATPDGATNAETTVGGIYDCRFLSSGSGSNYYSQVNATILAHNRTPIAGIALLTDDGTNPTITGYGILL
jgi:hypothetical protein